MEEQQKENNQSQTGSQNQIQEAKKVAVLNWWRGHCVEETKTSRKDPNLLQEKQVKQEEDGTNDMKKQVCHLQGTLRSEQKPTHGVPHTKTSNDLDRQEADRAVEKVVKDQGDAAELTEPEKITSAEQEQTQEQGTTDGLLGTIGRIEVMVSSALETAELVRQSEQRVSQVTQRMEDITQRVEETAGRAANTEEQPDPQEATVREKTSPQVCFCKKKKLIKLHIYVILFAKKYLICHVCPE